MELWLCNDSELSAMPPPRCHLRLLRRALLLAVFPLEFWLLRGLNCADLVPVVWLQSQLGWAMFPVEVSFMKSISGCWGWKRGAGGARDVVELLSGD